MEVGQDLALIAEAQLQAVAADAAAEELDGAALPDFSIAARRQINDAEAALAQLPLERPAADALGARDVAHHSRLELRVVTAFVSDKRFAFRAGLKLQGGIADFP